MPFVLDLEIATAVSMAASSSGKKGKLNIDDKVKSRKFNHSFAKDVLGEGDILIVDDLCFFSSCVFCSIF